MSKAFFSPSVLTALTTDELNLLSFKFNNLCLLCNDFVLHNAPFSQQYYRMQDLAETLREVCEELEDEAEDRQLQLLNVRMK